jgi:hypothetical protein
MIDEKTIEQVWGNDYREFLKLFAKRKKKFFEPWMDELDVYQELAIMFWKKARAFVKKNQKNTELTRTDLVKHVTRCLNNFCLDNMRHVASRTSVDSSHYKDSTKRDHVKVMSIDDSVIDSDNGGVNYSETAFEQQDRRDTIARSTAQFNKFLDENREQLGPMMHYVVKKLGECYGDHSKYEEVWTGIEKKFKLGRNGRLTIIRQLKKNMMLRKFLNIK